MRAFNMLALLTVAHAVAGAGYNYGAGLRGAASQGVDYAVAPAAVEFNNEFYSFAAPVIDFEPDQRAADLAGILKRHLRVIFIRAPEHNGNANATFQLANYASEQQTAIYVLTKQVDLSELANRLQRLNTPTHSASKPEVHFIKYRTQQDAITAQRAITREYEQLGDNSKTHNAGIAPTFYFASKVPAPVPQSGTTKYAPALAAALEPPVRGYLPAAAICQ